MISEGYGEAYEVECFSCGSKSWKLIGCERLKDNYWNILLQCNHCMYGKTERLPYQFNFENQVVSWLRKQGIIGHRQAKEGYHVQEKWFYPWDDRTKQYRLDKPRRYK
jgi:hypothetical protein